MPEATVNIEIYCAKCNAGICSNATFSIYRGSPTFTIEPCDKCLSDERDDGYDDGYGDAQKEHEGTE